MITAKGAGFLAAAIALFLLARLSQVGWLYLVDAVLWGMVLLSAGLPWLAVAFLAAQRRVESPCSSPGLAGPAEGDPLRIILTLQNRAFWPNYVLDLSYRCPLAPPGDRVQRFFVTRLTRSGPVSLESKVEAFQRGMHQLGPVEAESSAPFGFFRRRVRLTGPERVLVYPRVHTLRRLALAEGMSGTALRPQQARTGTEPSGSRLYLPGDPRRHIHWRNTARAGRLMVKEFQVPADRTLHLVFDACRVWGEGRETTLEYGIKVVASAADFARRNQVPVRVWGGGLWSEEAGPADEGPLLTSFAWPQLLKDLALVAPGGGKGLPETLGRLPPGASALVAFSPADESGVEAVVRAASRRRRLTAVSLEGFGEPEGADRALAPLRLAGVPVVRCQQGKLPEALQALEKVNGPRGSPVQVSGWTGANPACNRPEEGPPS